MNLPPRLVEKFHDKKSQGVSPGFNIINRKYND
jgi:hypothetical protein